MHLRQRSPGYSFALPGVEEDFKTKRMENRCESPYNVSSSENMAAAVKLS